MFTNILPVYNSFCNWHYLSNFILFRIAKIRNDGIYVKYFPLHLSFQMMPLKNLEYTPRNLSPLKEYDGVSHMGRMANVIQQVVPPEFS